MTLDLPLQVCYTNQAVRKEHRVLPEMKYRGVEQLGSSSGS